MGAMWSPLQISFDPQATVHSELRLPWLPGPEWIVRLQPAVRPAEPGALGAMHVASERTSERASQSCHPPPLQR